MKEDRERNGIMLSQIRDFQQSKIFVDHMRLTNDVLAIVQNTNLELLDGLIQNLACIFESFVPDLQEMMVEADKVNQQTKND